MGGVSSSLRIDDTLTRFGIDNIKSTAKPKLINGLRDECKKKTYIDDNDIDDTKIDQFLKKVYFVIDDQSKSEYVKKIIKLNPTIIPSEDTLVVLNRILNQDVIGAKVPHSFIDIYVQFPEEKRKNLLEDCQLDLSRALFNTNCQEDFWKLFENIYQTILENPTDKVEELYRKLDKLIIGRCLDFDVLSLKYFVSVIKDGISL